MKNRKLDAVRSFLRRKGLMSYSFSDVDCHHSEYAAPHFHCRSYLSGFHGSAGTLVVGLEQAGLWTDSRYFVEAEHALAGSSITLFRLGEPNVPDWPEWLAHNLAAGARVGCDPRTCSVEQFRRLEQTLRHTGVMARLVPDPLVELWPDRPPMPAAPAYSLPTEIVGQTRSAKLAALRTYMRAIDAHYHVISALDELAWLLNLRGGDVAYNPVVYAYLLVGADAAELFIDERALSMALRDELAADGIRLSPYGQLETRLGSLGEARLYFDPRSSAMAIREALGPRTAPIELESIVRRRKAIKNEHEIYGVRDCMRKDGVALVRFFRWLEEAVAAGSAVDEIAAAQRLRELRAAQPQFVDESFAPIVAFGGHGAIVHYEADRQSSAPLAPPGLLLVDSGGHYRNGTTDITRTVVLGEASQRMRDDFTVVLQAHIAVATLQFPVGATGQQLDAAARLVVWRQGRSFGHGVGHGVGFFLPVHESPPDISPRGIDPIAAGMLFSNEPGLYRVGEYGIRLENLVHVVGRGESNGTAFLGLQTLSLCYFDHNLIEVRKLTSGEQEWIDGYHRHVYQELLPLLTEAERIWLAARTAPLAVTRQQ